MFRRQTPVQAGRRGGPRSGAHGSRYRPALQELENRLVLSPPGTGWQLTLEDNFDGNALNTDLWRIDTSHRRDAQNTANALSVAGGYLTITTYTSGGIHYTGFIDTSKSPLLGPFGYWEASVKFQGASGMWSAFWLESPTNGNPLGDPATAGTEIDVGEHRHNDANGGNVSNKINSAIHWDGYGVYHQSVGQLSNNPTGTPLEGYLHTYAVLWTPDRYEFFVDGLPIWETTKAVSHRTEYLLLTSEVQDNSWAGKIPTGGYGDLGSSQAKMIVDWVRGWQRPLYGTDVGDVPAAGSDDLDEQGTWTVRGSGDIWGTTDRFHFVYLPMTGNGWITAQVTAVDNPDPYAKGGIMMRETLAADAKYATVFLTQEGALTFQSRSQTGGGHNTGLNLPGVGTPYGLYLERAGNTLTAWGTADYINWDFLWSESIPMAAKVYIGLAVSNHYDSVPNTTLFDYVSTSLDSGAPEGHRGIGRPASLTSEPATAAIDALAAAQLTRPVLPPQSSWGMRWDLADLERREVRDDSRARPVVLIGDEPRDAVHSTNANASLALAVADRVWAGTWNWDLPGDAVLS